MDHPVMSGREQWGGMTDLSNVLKELKRVARETNEEWAERLKIPASKHLTLVKPSGTVSQLVGSSSGIHPRYAPYYLRRVVQDSKDKLTDFMVAIGIPHVVREDKVIFSFPIKSPDGAVCARDIGAVQQLELWKIYQEYWCEGNPSQTIYYTDDEFVEIQAWLWKNWNILGGLSFFPLDDMIYDAEIQPYLEVDEDTYKEELSKFPQEIDWDQLREYEVEDTTNLEGERACSGGNCEL